MQGMSLALNTLSPAQLLSHVTLGGGLYVHLKWTMMSSTEMVAFSQICRFKTILSD